MNKLSSFTALVTASLVSITAETTWSDEATPNGPAAPAVQTPVPTTAPVPGWYPPPPNRGGYGYAQPWQQPPHWAAPPAGYGQLPPGYPPRGQSQAVPAATATAENPLSAELKQTQEQLTVKRTELDQARATLEQLESKLQHSLDAQQALNENVAAITSEQQALQARVSELSAELQTATDALQQAKSETTTSAQQLSDARAQAETFNNELTELKAQLESQQSTRLNAEQTLTEERDQLRSDLASRDEQLATLNTELQTATDALQQATSETTTSSPEPTQTQAALTAAQPEVAAGETLEVDAVEVAALQIATPDADQDGVPDSIDLCLETQQGIAVESTGCAADTAINLAGVNFGYNSHELTDEARRILDRVADILSQHADLHLQVAGHTDAQGDPAYNQWLSLQRAQAVRDYLVAQGVNSAHIGAAGYGGEQPIADNTTKEGLRMNRRVELRNAQ